ncbi:MAG TPA: molybdate ABC transporter substrate-binding protein, partial [Devosia sp.]|nr:molybdate ABC transporter substrate-binding protein [Devosia sp.]
MHKILVGALLLGVTLVSPAQAETASVAVAANFTAVAEQLAAEFKAETGNEVMLSFGATGGLYTQISQGAPFDILLAADDTRPAKAVAEGLGVEGSVFTYAIGSLALYSASLDVSDGEAALKRAFDKLAIADPKTAPYGQAAVETLTALGLYEAVTPKLVTGENISQTLQFVESGNAELGFVAASQVIGKPHVWIVPAELHEPIKQDAV